MSRYWLTLASSLALSAALGCGEDKGYGDPIENEFAEQSAGTAVSSAYQIHDETSNDAPVLALNQISASISSMANAKLQAQYQDQYPDQQLEITSRSNLVDEACVVIDGDSIVYSACDFQNGTLDGSVRLTDTTADVDLSIDVQTENVSASTRMRGVVTVTEDSLRGSLDFLVDSENDEITTSVDMFSDFDVDVLDGCAVGGSIEANVVSVSQTDRIKATQSLWVKATYGPECGEVVIR